MRSVVHATQRLAGSIPSRRRSRLHDFGSAGKIWRCGSPAAPPPWRCSPSASRRSSAACTAPGGSNVCRVEMSDRVPRLVHDGGDVGAARLRHQDLRGLSHVAPLVGSGLARRALRLAFPRTVRASRHTGQWEEHPAGRGDAWVPRQRRATSAPNRSESNGPEWGCRVQGVYDNRAWEGREDCSTPGAHFRKDQRARWSVPRRARGHRLRRAAAPGREVRMSCGPWRSSPTPPSDMS